MKAFYKKILIIGGATLILEAIIVYFLYISINAFYADLTKKLAYLLVEQVKNVIVSERFDISKFSQYNKYPTRRLMNRFSGEDSKILHILLIDTTNRIIISDDLSKEGKVYTSPRDLSVLDTGHPTIVDRKWEKNQEILDVVYPLMQDSVKQGYLRTVISMKHLENFYNTRRYILVVASSIALGIIVLTVFLTSRIYQSSLQNIENALKKLNETDYQYRVKYKKQDEFAPLFSRLNQLFDKTFDLNASFRQSEERIAAMMRVVHEGLMILDMDMNIISYNDYLLNLFQVSSKTRAEEALRRILNKNPALVEIFKRAKDPITHSVRKQLTVNLLNGKTLQVQVHALSLQEDGKVNGVILYMKNLGMLKELEQNLHRSMRYTIISQLASGVGHEIRNPLSSLAIHTEVLEGLTENLPVDHQSKQKMRKSIKILHTEIERITRLLDQFFNLAKPKEVELNFEDINDVVREVLELVNQQAIERQIKLHVRLGRNLPMVNISHDQIKQVLLNIILNAFDAMKDGGDLYIRTFEHEDKIMVVIRDTGQGIPENIRGKIFDLYFSTKPGGGGVGLAISKKIVEAHEGRLYFESEVGKGTRFFVELPRT